MRQPIRVLAPVLLAAGLLGTAPLGAAPLGTAPLGTALLVAAPLGAASLGGAGSSPPEALSPDRLARVVDRYNAWAASISTLTGGGEAVLGAPGEKDRTFRFSLVLSRPGHVRLQGRWGNLTTLFDLAATPEGWTLLLPRERKVVRSPDGDAGAGLLLSPRDIFACAMPEPVSLEDLRGRGAHAAGGDAVRLVVPPAPGSAELHRVLSVDPSSGIIQRLEVRRESLLEEPLLVAVYTDFEDAGPAAFPRSITVTTPERGWARFTFDSAALNESVDPRRFRILVPRGATTVRAEDVDPGFLPEAPGGGE
jgi:hypothetical protein